MCLGEQGSLSACFVHEHFLGLRTNAGVGVSDTLAIENVVFHLDYGTNRFVIAEVEGHSDRHSDSLHAAKIRDVTRDVNGFLNFFFQALNISMEMAIALVPTQE